MGSCACKEVLDVPHQERPKQPMWLLPMQAFLEMQGPPLGHQELQTLEKLVEWERGMFVLFVSHQWVGRKHPDPMGLQIRELRGALRLILSGELEVSYDLQTELLFNGSSSMPKELVERLRGAFIWYDYWSIPQESLAPAELKQAVLRQLNASVMAIPEYVSRSQLFVCLCPEMEHEATGKVCDINSWRERGWCRLEQLCASLRCHPVAVPETILVSSARKVSMQNAGSWMMMPVGEGSFTVQEDKELLRPVLSSLVETYTRTKARSSDPEGRAKSRAILAISQTLMKGMGGMAEVRKEPLEEELDAFLERFAFHSLLDRGEAGFGPVHCAALEGRPRLLEAAAALGADLEAPVKTPMLDIGFFGGETPLTFACVHCRLEAVSCLVRLRADIEQKDIRGMPLIHLMALLGTSSPWEHQKLLELFLNSGISVDVQGAAGMPLVAMCCGWGRGTKVLELLLERQASLHWCSIFGGPLHLAALWGLSGQATVDLLVKHKADVNAALQPDKPMDRLVLAGVQLAAPHMRGTSELWTVFPELRAATPLLIAALRGNHEVCVALLQHGADAQRRNARGHSPLDLALQAGHGRLVELLHQDSAADSPRS